MLLALTLSASLYADDAEKQERAEILRGSRLRAKETKIIQLADGKRVEANALTEPLFRYSDDPRDILDGTLWAYGSPGRPVALQKIEVYRNETRSFYCMTSLSDTLIEVGWRDGQKWSSKQPGIQFRQLPGGPKPAATEVGRLFQMKQIARRFDAKLFNQATEQDAQMRPLPRQIYRYTDPDRGIKDGVIFGYATYGTNPDALLSIELHGKGESDYTWNYGLARMTLYKVTVNLDDEEVWQVPYAPWQGPDRPSKFDTWLFFHEANVNETKE
jgi:hypothetical protein